MAEIVTRDPAPRGSAAGLSYWLGAKLGNQPLALEATLAARLQVALKEKDFDPSVVVTPGANRHVGSLAGSSAYRVTEDGVAIVQVGGLLLDRGSWLGDLYGLATTYEGLSEQFRRIRKDTAIKAVILDIDSGGGMVAGLWDLCDELADLAKGRKVVAVAANMAASAAYAIGCTAPELYVTSFGCLGSIGVVSLHLSYAEMLAQAGIEPTFIHAGAHKIDGNPYQQLSHLARAEMSAVCDQIHDRFVAHVAAHRPLDAEAVRATQARCYYGDKAVAAKLADGVKTFDQVLEHVRSSMSRPGGRSTPTKTGGRKVSQTTEQAAGRPDYDQIIAASLAAIAADRSRQSLPAVGSAPAAQPAAAPAAAPSAEPAKAKAEDSRARIKAILDCEAAKDRPNLARHLALETDLDAETAAAVLAKASAETAPSGQLDTALAREMAKPGNAAGIKPEASSDGKRETFVAFAERTAKRA